MAEPTQQQIAERNKMRGEMDNNLAGATMCWWFAIATLLVAAGLNCLWLTDIPHAAVVVKGWIIAPSAILLLLFGLLVGGAIASSAQARRLGKRLARDFQDTTYYD